MARFQRFSFIVLLVSLLGCGGGDGGFDGGTTPDPGTTEKPIEISLTLSDDTVTGQEPVTAIATVMQDGAALDNQVVTFKTNLGALSPVSGTSLTNANGIARITLTAGTVRGAGTITAEVASGEYDSVSFSSQGDDVGVVGDINISLTLVNEAGEETQTITSSKPGRVIAKVNGATSPLIVTFTTSVGSIPIPTAITNDDNEASVDIFADGELGAGTITASINSGEAGETLVVVGSSTVKMGSGTPLVEGVAAISLSEISAGGTTVVQVRIVDDQGNNFNEPVDVNFSSGCSGLSTPTASLSSPITTSNGVATSTYLAKGCVGNDPINVTANAGGINLSANTAVSVNPAEAGSIQFVSASPEYISIQGVGSTARPESSTIVFRVLDTNGNAVNNRDVDFSLNTDTGGITLIPTSATTDSNGLVQTVINSGTVSHTVTVTATIRDTSPSISTQSSNLIISTGIADQDSFTLGVTSVNVEAWNYSGVEVTVSARLADAFNNPPPPTVVYFTTEGGSIGNSSAESQCTTDSSGHCSVTWRSQNPKPEGHILGDINNPYHPPENHNTMGQKYGGRVTVLATTIGEESFPDLNGNGRFDECEIIAFRGGVGKPCNADGSIDTNGADIVYSGNDVGGNPYDLPEAFVDHNEDGVFNPSSTDGELGGELEEPSDFNRNGIYDGKDGLYNGVLCAVPNHAGCAEQKSVDVRDEAIIIMSGSHPHACISSALDDSATTVSLIRVDQGVGPDYRVDALLPFSGTPIEASADATIIARQNGLCAANVMRYDITRDWDNDSSTPDTTETGDYINHDYDDSIVIRGESVQSVSVTIADLHNQPMPAGTRISFSATVGSVEGPSEFVWGSDSHNGGNTYSVSIKGEEEPNSGSLLIEVTTPGTDTIAETSTVISGISIDIQ